MGRARNKRLNPHQGKDWFTPKQLNTRAAAFEYLLEKVDTLTDNITKLQAEVAKK